MITNLLHRSELVGFARKQAKNYDTKTTPKPVAEELLQSGWKVAKKNKKTLTLTRPKKKGFVLESRVWTLLYKMGFTHLNAKGGCQLPISEREESPEDQIDVVAVDSQVVLAIECKSFDNRKKDPNFRTWISRFAQMRKRITDGVKRELPIDVKRHVAMVVFTWDIEITENDRQRALENNVHLLAEPDLLYYESLVAHLGMAARYQLLSELFMNKQIAGLEIRVPALKTRQGKTVSYTFSLRPDYLLKIAYVAHRAKGSAIDVDTYQRMVSRNRLSKIATYITSGGSFPTNVVVNIRERRFAEFHQIERGEEEGGSFGWLTLRPTYGCAWVIDGQHRLFAYSGHERAAKSHLNVLAYEALSSPDQTQMFVDINSEQKKVSRSLLVELDAQLKWSANSEDDRIQAIISKSGLMLDTEPDSPLRNRIHLADAKRTPDRCISLVLSCNEERIYGSF